MGSSAGRRRRREGEGDATYRRFGRVVPAGADGTSPQEHRAGGGSRSRSRLARCAQTVLLSAWSNAPGGEQASSRGVLVAGCQDGGLCIASVVGPSSFN